MAKATASTNICRSSPRAGLVQHGSNDATKVMGIIVIFLAAQEGLGVTEYVEKHGFPLW